MEFRSWLEARTHGHDLKHVYHWDSESNWRKVLQKQDHNYGLWVSPNKDWNDHWASAIVSGQDDQRRRVFYLHTIGIPRDLYNKHKGQDRTAINWFGPETGDAKEFLILPQEWNSLIFVNVRPFKRSDLLKKHFRHLRRREMSTGRETGELASSSHPGATGKPTSSNDIAKWRWLRGDGEKR